MNSEITLAMKKTRIKQTLTILRSRDEAEGCMHDLAAAVNNQRKLSARRDAEVLVINRKYEASLAQCASFIAARTDQLRAWAEANPDEFPKGRKSIDFVTGILGFRRGTPKLALLSRAWTWEKVLAQLKKLCWSHFVRVKEEVDKDSILSAYSNPDNIPAYLDEDFKRFGVKVVQDESFFIEPNLTEPETRIETTTAT
jgi:phage host-nuclease inhibitor protein Gam